MPGGQYPQPPNPKCVSAPAPACVSAPRLSRRRATADAKRRSPPRGVKMRRYCGPCAWLARCVRPNCCTALSAAAGHGAGKRQAAGHKSGGEAGVPHAPTTVAAHQVPADGDAACLHSWLRGGAQAKPLQGTLHGPLFECASPDQGSSRVRCTRRRWLAQRRSACSEMPAPGERGWAGQQVGHAACEVCVQMQRGNCKICERGSGPPADAASEMTATSLPPARNICRSCTLIISSVAPARSGRLRSGANCCLPRAVMPHVRHAL